MMASRLADAGEQAGKQESNCRQASRQAIAGRRAGRQLQADYAGNCGAGGSTGGAGMLFS